ncbi:tRNA (guanosine(37)-N1)-methyltransferase TrmD [Colwellia sp. MB3u-28]|nr:tRNA (guanosine(37)-N1)-methyltransferase TrmD [Colwellia sp. MB02u-7]MBA6234606.1 tRNA (guanosine(37)-N1)-methyltransferase TrmD [Colwellia sp. MB02u-11]MBA6255470.1 tRNA (guanosine(37)-N1)-methyltransferase TrmD [Colwellia sp. MB3u-28]MBA6261610.1 tRNA (guanosine(37)-N1)-methyltransferase TrmD [Colwellia sp. MB3u-41]MBA6301160.1 tRNA (guanosine(37)-N1)-methyltransferase TrmD [Colwellia sp. MB3u-22]MBA6303598.1 tRNA (guanosine(37)-N1)-methyltransferase TrmD [Colwellia sp. MB02u-14]MBA6309
MTGTQVSNLSNSVSTNKRWYGVISLFPEMFDAITEYGVTGRAIRNGLIEFHKWNPRDFTHDKHRTVDDRPYGGGPGMLMMVQPLRDAIKTAKAAANIATDSATGDDSSSDKEQVKVIYLSPQGRKLDQAGVRELAQHNKLLFIAGRYEGIDERLIESEIDEEWSVGDYVLSGGELPAMNMIDAIARFVPGVLGHNQSAEQDSFSEGLLDCPHYTRPEVLDTSTEAMSVPKVLLSGNHEHIKQWRMFKSLERTWTRRPELLTNLALTAEQQKMLASIKDDNK